MGRIGTAVGTVGGFLIAGLGILAVATLVLGSHQACVSRTTGEVTYGHWAIDPLAWFGVTRYDEAQVCESETGAMYIAGKIPIFGGTLERTMGGPSNPAYYAHKSRSSAADATSASDGSNATATAP